MQNITLLSEIHPAATDRFNPLDQANVWHNLLTPADIKHLQDCGRVSFPAAMLLISQRCLEKGKTLLVRDWSHLDFTAVPFSPRRTDRLTTADVLQEDFRVINTASVRHPIDQWLSLRRLEIMQNCLDVKTYLQGYRAFAEHCTRIGFIRYEDFTADPETVLATLCGRLDMPYDCGFADRWSSYTNITGATGKGRIGAVIATPPRQSMEAGLLDEFEGNDDYRQVIKLLGYET